MVNLVVESEICEGSFWCKISRGAQLSGCPLTTEHHFKQQEQLSEAQKKDLFVKGKFDNFGRKYEFVNFKSDRNWSIYQLLLQWIANAFEVKVDLLHFAVFHCFRPNLIGFQVIRWCFCCCWGFQHIYVFKKILNSHLKHLPGQSWFYSIFTVPLYSPKCEIDPLAIRESVQHLSNWDNATLGNVIKCESNNRKWLFLKIQNISQNPKKMEWLFLKIQNISFCAFSNSIRILNLVKPHVCSNVKFIQNATMCVYRIYRTTPAYIKSPHAFPLQYLISGPLLALSIKWGKQKQNMKL